MPRRSQVRVGGERERDYGTPPGMYMVDRPPVVLLVESEHLSLMDKYDHRCSRVVNDEGRMERVPPGVAHVRG